MPGQAPITSGPALKAEADPYYELFNYTVPAFLPVLFGIVTPCCFTANGMLTKHLTSRLKHPFNPSTLAFSSYLIVNLIILIGAIIFWADVIFSSYHFWIGLVGSFINTIGIVCIQNAITTGPAGPASAIAALSCLLLVVIEAIKMQQMLSVYELFGFIFGCVGSLILVIPQIFEKIFCFCCLDKFRKED